MILIIYKSEVYKEFILPNTDNEDYEIILDKNLFGFSEDIEIQLDITDRQWKIYETFEYQMKVHGAYAKSLRIKDDDIINFETKSGDRFQGIVVEAQQAFYIPKKYDISHLVNISIGKDESNLIAYKFMELISKNHGELVREGNDFYIIDHSANGIFLNYRRIKGRVKLNFGDVINIFGLQIVYLGQYLSVGSNYGNIVVNENCLKPLVHEEKTMRERSVRGLRKEKKSFFSRSPRNMPEIATGKIEIEAPPNPRISKKKPLIYVVGPAFTMAIPMMLGFGIMIIGMRKSSGHSSFFMYTGIITAVGSAIIGSVWAFANVKYQKKSELEDEAERFNAYGNYLMQIVADIKQKYEMNIASMNEMYKPAVECCGYSDTNPRLWSRNYTHSDFLFHRLGIGNVPFQVEIDIPKVKFNVVYDNLRDKPNIIKSEYEELKNVPVGIDLLKEKLIGVVGGKGKLGAMQIVNALVSQIVTGNCYTDVKLAFFYDAKSEEEKKQWDFARWLPHVWSEDKGTRYIATNQLETNEIFYELTNIIRRRAERTETLKKGKLPKPYYILFIEDETLLEDQAIAKYIYEPKEEYGLTTIILADSYENLPNACERIIRNDSVFSGTYNAMDSSEKKSVIKFDQVSAGQLGQLARRLAEVQVKELESNTDIPSQLTFLEMYGVNSIRELHVLERWKKNRTYNTMKVPVGKKAGNADCNLDIHEKYHGPHGLIAGTTGSGKSETLQTYMLSLAINYSPYDVGFFVIDFKGGGMANLFSNLPHMVGQISNLSGNQVRRAMISIKSENRRRQRLFAEYGVNNINLYTHLYKNGEAPTPLPHLLIIIDEFAELKREEPDFMRELISVAQVGRSLGVHLILATQKPSGTVDDNIWSNSKFRLCLRVQDRQDSNDMLHKPDAAYITQAGRCYMQIGNDEIYELFQSAYSGAIYDENESDNNTNIATMITNSGKSAIVGSRTKVKRKEREKIKWYKTIISALEYSMKEKGIETFTDLGKADDYMLSEVIDSVVAFLNKGGIDYQGTKSNLNRLANFISIIPEDENDINIIAERIMRESSEKSISLPEVKEKTQLDAIIEYLQKVAKGNNYNKSMRLWLPVLGSEIYLEDITNKYYYEKTKWDNIPKEWGINAIVGLYDDPENQAQNPINVDFGMNGHYAVCGSVVSGKSVFLQTTLYSLFNKYSPDYLNVYILDFSSRMMDAFKDFPHVGGILYDDSIDELGKFFNMVRRMINERKKILNGGNYQQYVKVHGVVIPSVIIVIDNMASFREKTDFKYDELLIQLSREGVGYGIYLLIASIGFGLNDIPNRIADNIKNIISLNLGDKFKYMEIMRTTSIPLLPEEGIKGRGLVSVSGNILEFQTALSVYADDDYERARVIEKLGQGMREEWQGKCAEPIPYIPENPTFEDIVQNEEFNRNINSNYKLPFGYNKEDASIQHIDFQSTYCYAITGKNRTGKTNLLKVLMNCINERKERMAVLEVKNAELQKYAETMGAEYYLGNDEIFGFFKELTPVFVERNKEKNGLLQAGNDEDAIFEHMQKYPKIHIFIADLAEFFEKIYNPGQGEGKMQGFIETIIEKGALHNIYFYGTINTGDEQRMVGYRAYELFVDYKKGVHLGGNLNEQRIYNFTNIPYSDLTKSMKKGEGVTPNVEDSSFAEKVVIPMARK